MHDLDCLLMLFHYSEADHDQEVHIWLGGVVAAQA
jgi:hypothetical protein